MNPSTPLALCAVALAFTLAACSTTSVKPEASATPSSNAAPAAQPAPAAAVAAPAATAASSSESPMLAFERAEASLRQNSIYFDYDRAAIRPAEDTIITKHASLLENYPQDDVTLQGNCDERGSSEYNLALGQRRADAVKEKLVLLGVPERRIETVSFGKEKPRALCHQEKCWSQNRRADFVDAWK